MIALEIERKYDLLTFPTQKIEAGELEVISTTVIEQTYLAYSGTEQIRIRKIVDYNTGSVTYIHTFKKGSGIIRNEIEYQISEDLYEQLRKQSAKIPLIKTRSVLQGEHVEKFEIDQYKQYPYIIVEVEFGDIEAERQFIPPAWFGKDISFHKEYSNYQLWLTLQESDH